MEEKARREIVRSAEAKRIESERILAAQASTPTAPTLDLSIAPDWFHEPQKNAYEHPFNLEEPESWPTQDIVVSAGHQSGKTECEAHWQIRELQRSAPFIAWLGYGVGIFAGPTLTLMADQAIPAFRRVAEQKYNLGKYTGGNKPVFRLSADGMKRLFGFSGLDVSVKFAYASDSSNLESVTGVCGVWDEAGQKDNKQASLEAFTRRLTTARSTSFKKIKDWIDEDPGRQAQFAWWVEWYYDKEGENATFGRRMFGTTPYEWNFFKYEVYDPAVAKEPGYTFYNFPTWANPRNSKEKCDADRDRMPEWKWIMMYMGLFTKPAGVVFDTYVTVKRPDYMDPDWLRAAGHDFGKLNNAGVFLFRHPSRVAKNGRPQWVVYSTYLKGNRTAAQHIASYLYGEPKLGKAGVDGESPQYFEDLKKRPPESWRVGRKQGYAGVWTPVKPWAWGGNHTSEDDIRALYNMNGYQIGKPPVPGVMEGIEILYGMLKEEEIAICEDLLGLLGDLNTYSFELGADGNPDGDKILNKSRYHRIDCLRSVAVGLHHSPDEIMTLKPNQTADPEEKRNHRRARTDKTDEEFARYFEDEPRPGIGTEEVPFGDRVELE